MKANLSTLIRIARLAAALRAALAVLAAFLIGLPALHAASPPFAQQAYLKPAAVGNSQAFEFLGYSVAVSVDTMVVGARSERSDTTGVNSLPNERARESGAAYVFVRSGTNWTQQAYLKPAAVGTTQAGDWFGWSVAISGDTVVVGAHLEGSGTTGVNSTPDESATNSGAAYVFVRNGTNWTQQAYLKPADIGTTQARDEFGYSVAVSGDTVVVGARLEAGGATAANGTPDESATNSGAAYVFVRNGTNWTQEAYLKPAAFGIKQGGDRFGWSVAISADTVVVGAVGEDSSTTGVNSTPNESAGTSGAAYVFTRRGTNWTQEAYLKPAAIGTAQAEDRCGWSVAVSGDTVVVGAPYESSTTTGVNSTPNEDDFGSGAAYIFARRGTNWTQQAYLKPANRTSVFGTSVAVSGEMVVVGSPSDGSSTTGVNSIPNGSAHECGAAYVFARRGTNWTQQAYLKPAAFGTWQDFDQLGFSVAASGDTVVAGAPGEGSNTTGVNSTANEGATGSGAAYVFTIQLACPDDLVVSNTPGQCSATNVVFTVPDLPVVTCRLANTVITSPWSFNVGTNVVTCIASNFAGANVCTFNVIVRDAEAPVFTSCPTHVVRVVSLLSNAVAAVFSPGARDNCGTEGLVITCAPPSGSAFPLGTNHVVCTATDAAGNHSHCGFQVVVQGARGLKEGVLAELIALRAGVTDRKDRKKLDEAIKHLTRSLDPDLWVDQTHLELRHGERAFEEEKETVEHLLDALKRRSTTLSAVVVRNLIDRIVHADRLLAAVAIAEARAAAGDTERLRKAQREFARGDAEAAEGHPDKAIEHYAHAWHEAMRVKPTKLLRAPDGRAQLQFMGEPRQRYVIQCSPDLKTWTTLATRTADANGLIEYDDAEAGKHPARFYRLATP